MISPAPSVIFSTEGFTARPDLLAQAEVKAAKLRRHRLPSIGQVRVHVKRETNLTGPVWFSVCASAETPGPDHLVHAEALTPETAVNAAFAKLERAVAAAAGVRKHQWHTPAAHPETLLAAAE